MVINDPFQALTTVINDPFQALTMVINDPFQALTMVTNDPLLALTTVINDRFQAAPGQDEFPLPSTSTNRPHPHLRRGQTLPES